MVEKVVLLEFVRNCHEVCQQLVESAETSAGHGLCSETLPPEASQPFFDEKVRHIDDALVRIQTHLSISSLVENTDKDEVRRRILRVGMLLSPVMAVEMEKIRIGGPADGGYVMLDDFNGIVGACSFGVNDDDSWDKDIASREIDVHQYDHTIVQAPTRTARLSFFHEMIAGKDHLTGTSLTKAVGRHAEGPLVLKSDIEGSEWEVFASTEASTLARFSQIVCEFHSFGSIVKDDFFAQAERALLKLSEAFAVVHIHANNSAPFLILGGVPFPSVLEVTFASKRHYKFTDSDVFYPTDLDRPNAPSLPDHYLGRFEFQL
jgi:hypothetical protein